MVMRLGVVGRVTPRFGGGGYVHALEVIKGIARVAGILR